MGCHFLLQEIFPTQGLNLGLPHGRQTLYLLSHPGIEARTKSKWAKGDVFKLLALFSRGWEKEIETWWGRCPEDCLYPAFQGSDCPEVAYGRHTAKSKPKQNWELRVEPRQEDHQGVWIRDQSATSTVELPMSCWEMQDLGHLEKAFGLPRCPPAYHSINKENFIQDSGFQLNSAQQSFPAGSTHLPSPTSDRLQAFTCFMAEATVCLHLKKGSIILKYWKFSRTLNR